MNPNDVLQAAFNKAVAGVLMQGGKSCMSSHNSTSCAYRGEGGFKCAVGQLLTDEQITKYNVKEGSTPEDFSEELLAEVLPGVNGPVAEDFMEALQQAHDGAMSANFKQDFLRRANKVAEGFNLNPMVMP